MPEPPFRFGVSAPVSRSISVGDTLAGRFPGTLYQVEEQLGAGGVGAVYRVTRKNGGASFALKVLHRSHSSSDALRKRFEREAQALGALSHPNVVAISDYGTASDGPYLVMELLRGESLSQRLQRKRLDAAELRRYGGELLSALAYVHGQGLAHRDVKPGNVFLHEQEGGEPRAKVLDFGFVKFVEGSAAKEADPLTRTGEMFGTPAYMPPEQIGGEATNARTDVYALGVVLFEMITGRRPFEGDAPDILRGHLAEEPPSLASVCPGLELAPGLEALIARALKKRPEERFEHAGEMLASFERLPDPLFGPHPETSQASLGEASTIADPGYVPASSTHAKRPVRLSVLAWLSLAVILAAGVAAYQLTGRTSAHEPPAAPTAAAPTTSVDRKVDAPQPAAPEPPQVANVAAPEVEAPQAAVAEPAEAPATPPGVPDLPAANPQADNTRPEARNPWRRPMPDMLRRVLKAVENRTRVSERAIKALRVYNREHPGDARGHLLLAGEYYNRGWKDDALTQYELVAQVDPTARGATAMLGQLLTMLDKPSTGERASALIAELYGPEALPPLGQALASPPKDPEHRARLQALHARLSSKQ